MIFSAGGFSASHGTWRLEGPVTITCVMIISGSLVENPLVKKQKTLKVFLCLSQQV